LNKNVGNEKSVREDFVNLGKLGIFAAIVVSLAVTSPGQAQAQAEKYPSKPIDILVPFAPGGSTGLSARALAGALEERFKVRVRVVHKPGGNTVPALDEVMRSKPDGYTLLLDSPASSSMLEVVVPNLPLKVMDRTFIAMFGHTPMVLITATESPFNSLGDAVAQLKRDPGTFTWTSLGGAGAQDITFRQLFKEVGVDLAKTRPVSSRGGTEPITLAAGGNVMIGAGSWSSVATLHGAKMVRALAVTSPERHPAIPDVPTTAQAGFPGVQLLFWASLSGPPGMPDEAVATLDKALSEITADPKFIAALAGIGIVPYYQNAATFKKIVQDEKKNIEALWGK
jgi:putative tricarboxylic transport membrane protein